jgi:formate/nitrite transporter FocA (FNT family)
MSQALESTFERTVDEGFVRLTRTWPSLVATGVVGGIDVGMGVLALLLVEHATHRPLLGALAFGIGFVALTLANSELFTENFLVPVAAVAARDASVLQLVRLWVGTLASNLAGAWVLMGLAVAGFPAIRATAVELAAHPASQALGLHTLANMVVAGSVITLMTWMERSTESVPGKLVAAVVAAFLLAAGPMDHAIVVSIEMFAALHAGATFGYAQWAGFLGWAVLGNMLGGLGLVTMLRIIQVGGGVLREEQDRDPGEPREEPPEGTT